MPADRASMFHCFDDTLSIVSSAEAPSNISLVLPQEPA